MELANTRKINSSKNIIIWDNTKRFHIQTKTVEIYKASYITKLQIGLLFHLDLIFRLFVFFYFVFCVISHFRKLFQAWYENKKY